MLIAKERNPPNRSTLGFWHFRRSPGMLTPHWMREAFLALVDVKQKMAMIAGDSRRADAVLAVFYRLSSVVCSAHVSAPPLPVQIF